ncbi:hypothetical protein NBRC116597_36370 [Phaeobacter sp. NW0010-22]
MPRRFCPFIEMASAFENDVYIMPIEILRASTRRQPDRLISGVQKLVLVARNIAREPAVNAVIFQ